MSPPSTEKNIENPTEIVDDSPEVAGKLSNFPISPETVTLLEKKGVSYLFPIQIKTFDHIYSGKDVVGQASRFTLGLK